MPLPALARHAAAYGVTIALLCVPALWNGFPLMFDDVGGYLERWPTGSLGLGRSTVYGLMLWGTRSAAFVPVIVLQALVTAFVVDCSVAVFAPARPRWMLPVVVAAIAATSGAALYVCKPIPDAWAAPAVLALHLVAWHGASLAKWERAALAAIVVFAGATHMATFGVLAGLSVLYAIAWLARRRFGFAPRIGAAIMAVWSSLLLLLVGNVMAAGQFTLGSDGEIFLFARMVEDGMAANILAEECPRADWQLCRYRDALPAYAEAFMFDADSPLRKIGGAADPRARAEIAAIIARSLARHPLAHAARARVLTAGQFVDVGTGGAIEPLMSGRADSWLRCGAPANRRHRRERLERLGCGAAFGRGIAGAAGARSAGMAKRPAPRCHVAGNVVRRTGRQRRDLWRGGGHERSLPGAARLAGAARDRLGRVELRGRQEKSGAVSFVKPSPP